MSLRVAGHAVGLFAEAHTCSAAHICAPSLTPSPQPSPPGPLLLAPKLQRLPSPSRPPCPKPPLLRPPTNISVVAADIQSSSSPHSSSTYLASLRAPSSAPPCARRHDKRNNDNENARGVHACAQAAPARPPSLPRPPLSAASPHSAEQHPPALVP